MKTLHTQEKRDTNDNKFLTRNNGGKRQQNGNFQVLKEKYCRSGILYPGKIPS